MMRDFNIESMSICEYASQDFQGRNMLIGIFPNVISFEVAPATWPQLFMNIYLKPIAKRFKFDIYFLPPNEKNFATFKMNYENVNDPDPRERVVFTAQMPPAKFQGPGIYKFGVRQEREIIFEREYFVDVGSQLPVQLGKVTGIPEVNLK